MYLVLCLLRRVSIILLLAPIELEDCFGFAPENAPALFCLQVRGDFDRRLLACCERRSKGRELLSGPWRDAIRRAKQAEGLIQITRAYCTNAKGEEPVLTRNEYTVIEPQKEGAANPGPRPCSNATGAIVVEGPGKRSEMLQVCVDPNCEVHGKPNSRAEKEAATRQREEERQERAGNRERNRQLLDAVLDRIPAVLTRDDYKMLLFAFIERLDYSDWEVLTERHKIDTDEIREPDAAAFELRKKAEDATDSQLVRMLFEIALSTKGQSDQSIMGVSACVSM